MWRARILALAEFQILNFKKFLMGATSWKIVISTKEKMGALGQFVFSGGGDKQIRKPNEKKYYYVSSSST